ncbi:ubiquitin-conjugating enzyme E2 D2B-like [Salmo trutta]|uniref:ubiquitin-conjugating enzyme E2 D2B-like n=1 Tax=Salmo trutta TaxID=8032 RepID=UPI0011329211|nr:ubiquitin-conjugating enzyme E2 D2B-like [Salmo trutta]
MLHGISNATAFWKIVMQGPPDTPYEKGALELYCQFGAKYPVKPPLVRFVTPVYHCNVNSVDRICHNIFDRNYSAHITMREILDAVYGLLIVPEPEDPLDSISAEEFLSSSEIYEQEAKSHSAQYACDSMYYMEKKLVGEELTKKFTPSHLICPLTKKMFIDPVKNQDGTVYERKAIEKHLKMQRTDPKTKKLLRRTDLKSDATMQKMVMAHRKKNDL